MSTWRVAALLCCAFTVGCATPPPPERPVERIILLPGPTGETGRLLVTAPAGSTELASAYGTAAVTDAGRVASRDGDGNAIRQEFAATLAGLPPRPVSHTLYFLPDSDVLTEASEAAAQAVLQDLARRPVADIVVIGHTDTLGEEAYNDTLSLQRARAVRDLLVARGGDPARIEAAGRGEREPRVPTPDETPEPRNRRAELSLR